MKLSILLLVICASMAQSKPQYPNFVQGLHLPHIKFPSTGTTTTTTTTARPPEVIYYPVPVGYPGGYPVYCQFAWIRC